jgi:hypothetical protein
MVLLLLFAGQLATLGVRVSTFLAFFMCSASGAGDVANAAMKVEDGPSLLLLIACRSHHSLLSILAVDGSPADVFVCSAPGAGTSLEAGDSVGLVPQGPGQQPMAPAQLAALLR